MDDLDEGQTFDRLLTALGHFSMDMLVTYVLHRDQLPDEMKAKFDTSLKDWNAVSGELVVWERMKQQAVCDAEG
jgi:hypothetical protein